MARRDWERPELLLALNLYCKLPFGQMHSKNGKIIKLAVYLDRSPSAVAMKLVNFASLDPYHQQRNVKGLANASKADVAIWNEFHSNWAGLAIESELAYQNLDLGERDEEVDESLLNPQLEILETERVTTIKARIGQSFFRQVIITSYQYRCCVCGLDMPDLLVASHIVPWRDDVSNRVNPCNGLSLCAIHDRGFDRGYFTIGEEYEVLIGNDLKRKEFNDVVNQTFLVYENQLISLPEKFRPDPILLQKHRTHYFRA